MPVNEKTAALLERLGANLVPLVLIRREVLSPCIVELEFAGPVEDLAGKPGNDVMVDIPTTDPEIQARRRYSIRSIDIASQRMRLWVETSSGGPGATWAQQLPTGAAIEVIGPRGQISLDLEADWHCFVGDMTVVSAAYAMAEAIEPPGQALFVIEVNKAEDLILPQLDEYIAVTVVAVDRDGRLPNDPSGLVAAFSALELPELDGHVYLGGELSVVAALRKVAKDRGLADVQLSSKPYWRYGVANLPHGEPKKDN